jgi:hypothetical protein
MMKTKTIHLVLILVTFAFIWLIKSQLETYFYWDYSLMIPLFYLFYVNLKLFISEKSGLHENSFLVITCIFIGLILYYSLSNWGEFEIMYRRSIPLLVGGVLMIGILFVRNKYSQRMIQLKSEYKE